MLASKERITERTCKSPGFMIEINSTGLRLLNDVVKRNTNIDSIGPFQFLSGAPFITQL